MYNYRKVGLEKSKNGLQQCIKNTASLQLVAAPVRPQLLQKYSILFLYILFIFNNSRISIRMKKKGFIVQLVGLPVMGVGIGLQLKGDNVNYLFVTLFGLLVVFAGLFITISQQKKEK